MLLSAGDLVFAALVVFAASTIRGTAGFGGSLLAVPLLALIMPLHVVVPVVTMITFVSCAIQMQGQWQEIAWTELLRLAPFTLVGILSGCYLVQDLGPTGLARGFGVFLMVYAVLALVLPLRLQRSTLRPLWPAAAALGSVGGLVGWLFGTSSPFYAIYLDRLVLTRHAFRATLAALLLSQAAVRTSGYAALGMIDLEILIVATVLLPFTILGTRLSENVSRRLAHQLFIRAIGTLVFLNGCALALK